MTEHVSRRKFAGAVASVTAAGVLAQAGAGAFAQNDDNGEKRLVVGVACSPRKDMTTAAGLKLALAAVRTTNPNIETRLLDLGGLSIAPYPGPGDGKTDDFGSLTPTLMDPRLAGLIIGSPVYFRGTSALCRAFIERLGALRSPNMILANKVVGALSVGAVRNGGLELTLEQIHSAMLCHEVLIVGGRNPAMQGAMLINNNDSIDADGVGQTSARLLGERIAQAITQMG